MEIFSERVRSWPRKCSFQRNARNWSLWSVHVSRENSGYPGTLAAGDTSALRKVWRTSLKVTSGLPSSGVLSYVEPAPKGGTILRISG